MWIVASDAYGVPHWYNTATGAIDYNSAGHAATPQAAPMSFVNANNAAAVPSVYPAAGPAAEAFRLRAEAAAWKEGVDKNTGDTYWYNTMTNNTTWDKPKVEATPSPPPPPPPRAPQPKKRPEKEADQWEVVTVKKGKNYYYNKKTGQSQFDRPDCLRRYR